jgi:hypothetical protein
VARRLVEHATGRSPWRRAVESTLREVRADVVHAHFGPAGCDLVDITRALGLPLVTSLYGVDAAVLPYLPQWRDRYARLFARASCSWPKAGDAQEDHRRRRARRTDGHPADRHPPGQVSALGARRLVDGALRRPLREKKGLLDAIAAFDRARRSSRTSG